MEKKSIIRFVNVSVQQAFESLKKGDMQEKEMYRLITQAMDNLEKNAFCGIQIPKQQIPSEYRKNYAVDNLWKYDLPRGWRLIYSIRGEQAFVVSIVLEWFFSHKEYERRFHYS